MTPLATFTQLVEAIPQLTGFLFVLLILTSLWLYMEAVGSYFKKKDKGVVVDTPKTSATATPSTKTKEPEITDEELAAVTACVMALMGSQSRIVSIRSGAASWGHEGRREHFASHRIR